MDKKQFIITDEIVQHATDYIPLASKQAIANIIAQGCIEPVEMTLQKAQSDATLALPQQYKEDIMLKKIHLGYYFLTEYLHIDVPEPFDTEVYDDYFRFHPIEQLERFKSKPELKDKVFNLLADFRELKKLVDTEIYNLKLLHNDIVERMLAGITVGTSPEFIKQMTEEMKKLAGKIETEQANAKNQTTQKAKAERVKSNAQTKQFVDKKDKQ